MRTAVLDHPALPGYELLDSGRGEKLERFGTVVLRRPDPQAIWLHRLDHAAWQAADLSFERESDRGGSWRPRLGAERPPREWDFPLELPGLPTGARLRIRPTPFKHVGLFPEQASNWLWLEARRAALAAAGVDQPRILNLFAYTGAATILAARAGCKLTHLDASRASLDWAAENASLSGLGPDAVRWILDDAVKFVAREGRRGARYHGILLDPPAYGRGPGGEKWSFGDGIAPLLETCRALLEPGVPSFLLLSAYAIEFSPLAFHNLLAGWGGEAEIGELALPERDSPRLLPCGMAVRWVQDRA